MFNQLTLTCAFVDEAIPCRHASQFQYLNEVINKPSEPFLTDADVTSGFSYYSNRIMSDGARARAYQDSQLLAQIGGQPTGSAISSSFQEPAGGVAPFEPRPVVVGASAGADSAARPHGQQAPGNFLQDQQTLESPLARGWPEEPATVVGARLAANQQVAQNSDENSFSFSLLTSHQPSGHFRLQQASEQPPQLSGQVHHSAAAAPPQPEQLVVPLPAGSQHSTLLSPTTTTTTLPTTTLATTLTGSAAATTTTTSTTTTGGRQALLATTTGASTDSPPATTTTATEASSSPGLNSNLGLPTATAGQPQQFGSSARAQTVARSRQAGRQQRRAALAFQSSRLSAARPKLEQQQSALVMRKRSGRSAGEQRDSATDFWRQANHLQHFGAPKFESLILRRRV